MFLYYDYLSSAIYSRFTAWTSLKHLLIYLSDHGSMNTEWAAATEAKKNTPKTKEWTQRGGQNAITGARTMKRECLQDGFFRSRQPLQKTQHGPSGWGVKRP